MAERPKRLDPAGEARLLELGAQTIYDWSSKRRQPWSGAADETRAAYRTRMRELLNELARAGYEIKR